MFLCFFVLRHFDSLLRHKFKVNTKFSIIITISNRKSLIVKPDEPHVSYKRHKFKRENDVFLWEQLECISNEFSNAYVYISGYINFVDVIVSVLFFFGSFFISNI